MSLAQMLERYATTAAAVLLVVGVTLAWLISRDLSFKRDMRSSQRYFVAFIGLVLLRKLIPEEWAYLDKLAYITCVTIFTFGAIRALAGAVFHVRRTRSGVDTPKILRDLVDAGLFLLAIVFIVQTTLNINLSALLASSAVISLVLGLALQETLSNLFSGLSLQAERPFAAGDWVRIGTHSGRLLEIGWRATRIVTGAGEVLTLPNNAVGKEAIYNLSKRGATLRKISIGIGYEVVPNTIKEVLLELVRFHAGVAGEPAPTVRVAEFGPRLVTYELLFWVAKYEDGGPIEDEIRSHMWYRLRRANIELPVSPLPVRVSREPTTATAAHSIDVAALLAKVDFLAVVAAPIREQLATNAAVVHFGRGETIIRQGDPTPGPFYVVASGEVAVRVRSPDGVQNEVARLTTPGFFGEMALLTGEPRTASVVALCDATLVALERRDFGDLFARNPELAGVLANVLAERRQGLVNAASSTRKSDTVPAPESSQLLDRLRQIFRQLT